MKKKKQILTKKPVYLGRSILEIRKIVMYIFWYDYVKPKYVEKVKLFYMETDLVYRHSFIVYMRTEDIYANIAKCVETSLIFQIMN